MAPRIVVSPLWYPLVFGDFVKFTRKVAQGIAASALLVMALAGCAANEPGAAAVLGDQRITESELATEVGKRLEAQGLTSQDSTLELNASTLSTMIIYALLDELAVRESVTATQGEIDTTRLEREAAAGGPEQFAAALAASGVMPEDRDNVIRLGIIFAKLGEALAPGSPEEVKTQAIGVAVSELSVELGTEVAPRFGTWDPQSLAVGPVSNTVSEPLGIELGQE